jgi:hypothetical protein
MRKLLVFVITILLISCSKPVGEGENQIPEGAIWAEQTIRRDKPLTGFAAIAPWAQAATVKPGQNIADSALIEVDYWKILEVINGSETQIFIEDYNYTYLKTFSLNEAGLYCRYPKWFDPACNDYHSIATNMTAMDGMMTLNVALTPDNIVHWWTPRLACKPNASYIIEARVRITGKTALQFGMDYWRNLNVGFNVFDPECILSNNCEAWISDWILPTNGKFVTVKVPVR